MSYSLSFSQAIVAVVFIADKVQQGIFDFVPTKKLSESLNIAGPTAVKILQNLNRAGIIETREGAKGGVRLAVQSSQITILDIFNAIEFERPLFRHNYKIGVTGVKPTKTQEAIKEVLSAAERSMKDSLSNITVENLLEKINQ